MYVKEGKSNHYIPSTGIYSYGFINFLKFKSILFIIWLFIFYLSNFRSTNF